jgi:uncharacterized membrane protein
MHAPLLQRQIPAECSIALFAITLASAAFAQPSIVWYTIDSGGGVSTGPLGPGTISIHGTAGQSDAGACVSVGMGVRGGYWSAGAIPVGCPADLDDGGGGGVPDGAITIEDLLFFLIKFESGETSADLDDDGNPTIGTPDGAVTVDDLLFFLVRFEEGC